ncbi:hypothetical protein J2T04_004048 [Chryseobacterium lathyri]|uniref:Uncharacterized protein n=1 Tax=Chryseobacterium lathyri TaxID=395933 RepID=A0ABT9SRP5_9FLAO|nr:hypothetical protein [Chryseobacterium lathyri]
MKSTKYEFTDPVKRILKFRISKKNNSKIL